MKKIMPMLIAGLFFCAPMITQAQEWSQEQLTVWTAVEDFWSNMKQQNSGYLINATHKDYRGWGFTDQAPGGKDELAFWASTILPERKVMHISLNPLEIMVNGNTAVLHYYYTQYLDKGDGMEVEQGRWTDVWVKDGDRWLLYADSGGELDD